MEYYTVIKNDVFKNIDVWTWKDVHNSVLENRLQNNVVMIPFCLIAGYIDR